MTQSASHDYLSTACFHGLHDRCRKHCKFCDVPCKCSCHGEHVQAGAKSPTPEHAE